MYSELCLLPIAIQQNPSIFLRSDVKNVLAFTADERVAAQQMKAADGEE